MSAEAVALRLARWVVDLRYEDLSPEVVLHAKRCMLDTLGVQIRGATLPWILPVYRYVRSISGTGEATVSYYGDRLTAPYAAYANSTFSYSCELQHHGSPESGHPGVIVIPIAQALGEQLGSSGREIIAAMVGGYEVQGRLGACGLFKSANKRHFHAQGVMGVFSAAATAGKLLGLDEQQLAHAFAIAGSYSSTILEYDQSGGEVKRTHGAIAAQNGMQAAFLAKEGMTGPLTVFEGKHGICASFGGREPDAEQILSSMGQPYCIARCRFRIHPASGICVNALDILIDLVKEHSFSYRDVERIRVGMPEEFVSHVTSITQPHDVISAQASMGFNLALRLVKGNNDLDRYINPDLWRDPEVLAMAHKLEGYILKDKANPRMTRVEIMLKNGKVPAREEGITRGSEALPFSQEVLDGKFRGLAGVLLSRDRVDQIMKTVARLEQLPSIRELVPLLQKQ